MTQLHKPETKETGQLGVMCHPGLDARTEILMRKLHNLNKVCILVNSIILVLIFWLTFGETEGYTRTLYYFYKFLENLKLFQKFKGFCLFV